TPVVETLPLHVFSKKASDYLRRQMRDGRIYVGFDVDDDGLGFAVQKAGRDAFVFGSDFPHEVFNAEKCRHEIDQLLARGDLDSADKAAVLGGNARRFFRLGANGR
ncbi:MAG: amidohydrolase family protein, partial [Candidatus Binatia bacterium]